MPVQQVRHCVNLRLQSRLTDLPFSPVKRKWTPRPHLPPPPVPALILPTARSSPPRPSAAPVPGRPSTPRDSTLPARTSMSPAPSGNWTPRGPSVATSNHSSPVRSPAPSSAALAKSDRPYLQHNEESDSTASEVKNDYTIKVKRPKANGALGPSEYRSVGTIRTGGIP